MDMAPLRRAGGAIQASWSSPLTRLTAAFAVAAVTVVLATVSVASAAAAATSATATATHPTAPGHARPGSTVRWTAQQPDTSKRAAGYPILNGTVHTQVSVFDSDWQYTHANMVGYSPEGGILTVTWKAGHLHEDRPGQKVSYVQTRDGVTYTPQMDLFPNISLPSFNVHLFSEPFVHVASNGHMYAAASPKQFCLFPDQYESILLMRRLYGNATGVLGPLFWASPDTPPGYGPTSAVNDIKPLSRMDAGTQADMAELNNASQLPCLDPASGVNKCEACLNGCQDWSAAQPVVNERTHYVVPGTNGTAAQVDVLLYRTDANHYAYSMRTTPDGTWARTAATNIPDVDSNLNAGVLPDGDGRVYLVSNAAPATNRDPLTIATSTDGYAFDTVAVLATCDQMTPHGASGPAPPYGCALAYPQAIPITKAASAWRGAPGLYTAWSYNKKSIWVTYAPLPLPREL